MTSSYNPLVEYEKIINLHQEVKNGCHPKFSGFLRSQQSQPHTPVSRLGDIEEEKAKLEKLLRTCLEKKKAEKEAAAVQLVLEEKKRRKREKKERKKARKLGYSTLHISTNPPQLVNISNSSTNIPETAQTGFNTLQTAAISEETTDGSPLIPNNAPGPEAIPPNSLVPTNSNLQEILDTVECQSSRVISEITTQNFDNHKVNRNLGSENDSSFPQISAESNAFSSESQHVFSEEGEVSPSIPPNALLVKSHRPPGEQQKKGPKLRRYQTPFLSKRLPRGGNVRKTCSEIAYRQPYSPRYIKKEMMSPRTLDVCNVPRPRFGYQIPDPGYRSPHIFPDYARLPIDINRCHPTPVDFDCSFESTRPVPCFTGRPYFEDRLVVPPYHPRYPYPRSPPPIHGIPEYNPISPYHNRPPTPPLYYREPETRRFYTNGRPVDYENPVLDTRFRRSLQETPRRY